MDKMVGCTGRLARLLAYVLAAVLILNLPVALLASNTLRLLTSSVTWSEIGKAFFLIGGVREEFAREFLMNVALGEISAGEKSILDSLRPQDRIRITQILIPDDWITTQIQENVDRLLLWVESETPAPKFSFNIEPLKTNLKDGGAQRIVNQIIDTWSDCTPDQSRQIEEAMIQGSLEQLPICRLSGDLRVRMVEFISQKIFERLDQLPSEIPLGENLDAPEGSLELSSFRKQLLVLSFDLRLARILPIFLLGTIMTLAIRSWRELGQWWGLPLSVGALLGLLLVIGMHVVGPGLLKGTFPQPEQAGISQEPILEALWILIALILNRTLFQAVIVFVLALGLFLVTWALTKRRPVDTKTQPTEHKPSGEADILLSPPSISSYHPSQITRNQESKKSTGEPDS